MKISVIIPTRNRRPMLERTLLALAAQTDAPSFEVCVIDNGSSDSTAQLLAHCTAGLTLQSIFEAEPNRALARNRGIDLATGELLVFIDDDVLVPPHFLAAHAAAHADGQARVVTGPIMNVPDANASPRPQWFNHSRAYFCTCNASVPTNAVRAVGNFDRGFSGYGWEDTELGVRLRKAGLGHAFAWRAFVYHLKPPGFESFADATRRMREKGAMARRFVAKCGDLRVRLATGDYALNHARGAILGAAWTMPLAERLAQTPSAPAFIRALARGHYLDGVYRAALRARSEG